MKFHGTRCTESVHRESCALSPAAPERSARVPQSAIRIEHRRRARRLLQTRMHSTAVRKASLIRPRDQGGVPGKFASIHGLPSAAQSFSCSKSSAHIIQERIRSFVWNERLAKNEANISAEEKKRGTSSVSTLAIKRLGRNTERNQAAVPASRVTLEWPHTEPFPMKLAPPVAKPLACRRARFARPTQNCQTL